MRLLILTQTVDRDDPTLGFFHQWIEEFARHCEQVYAVCLFEGVHSLPPNVTVLSLGKEQRREKARSAFSRLCFRLWYLYRFCMYIWKYRKDYDAVFVHMNQLYVLLGSPLWRLWGKRVCLWYAHGAVSWSLRFAECAADAIITSTAEGFRLASNKIHIVGQGIDTKRFVQCDESDQQGYRPECIRIVYVGRIALVKHCEILVEAVALLHAQGERVTVTFIGDISVPTTHAYYRSLRERVCTLGIDNCVTFVGGVANSEIVQYLCMADVLVNPSETGSLDKAGLEGIAAGVPVITCNEAFAGVFGIYKDRLMFPKGDARTLADYIVALHRSSDRTEIINTLREVVKKEHSLERLIPRILVVLREVAIQS